MKDRDVMWVLVREADVIAAAGLGDLGRAFAEADWRALCGDFLRTRLMCYPSLPTTTEIVWPLACRAPEDLPQFWSILRRVRAGFHEALACVLDRLCELVPEAGADHMEIPIGSEGGVDRQEALFPMAAVVLTSLVDRLAEGEEAKSSSSLPVDAVHDVLTDLATLLSDHLTGESPFFDAGSRSVHIPDERVLTAALGRGESFLLLPVRRGRA